jgi:predicted RNA methylase
MKLKHLEAALQDMEIFEQPKVHLEQYPTTPHLAACVLYEGLSRAVTAFLRLALVRAALDTVSSHYSAHNKFDDIQDRAVLDLGCGTCMLSTAAKILGAGYVCGVDVDGDALEIAQRNVCRCQRCGLL